MASHAIGSAQAHPRMWVRTDAKSLGGMMVRRVYFSFFTDIMRKTKKKGNVAVSGSMLNDKKRGNESPEWWYDTLSVANSATENKNKKKQLEIKVQHWAHKRGCILHILRKYDCRYKNCMFFHRNIKKGGGRADTGDNMDQFWTSKSPMPTRSSSKSYWVMVSRLFDRNRITIPSVL